MDREKNLLEIYCGIYLWVGLADGEFDHSEYVQCFNKLKHKFTNFIELESELKRISRDYQKNYNKKIKKLKELIIQEKTHLNGPDLFMLAQRAILDDGKLLPGEELAIENIQTFFNEINLEISA